jgi:hypothetical protein
MPELVRIADSHDPVTGFERIGIAQHRDREIGRPLDKPNDRAVRDGIAPDDCGPIGGRVAAEQPNFDDVRVGDHVIVGQNVSVRADEKARRGFTLDLRTARECAPEEAFVPLGIFRRGRVDPCGGLDRDDGRAVLPRDGAKDVGVGPSIRLRREDRARGESQHDK